MTERIDHLRLEEKQNRDLNSESGKAEQAPQINFNELLKNDSIPRESLVHPKPGLPDLEVGPDAKKPADIFQQVMHNRLPGNGGDRFRFFRNDENNTIEHEALYQPGGKGIATWYRDDGSKTHRQYFQWKIDEYVKEGHVGIIRELETRMTKIDEYDASGKNVMHRYMFNPNGNVAALRDYNERGGLTSLKEFRPDGTLQTQVDYKRGIAHRKHFSQEEDIRLKLDPYIIRKPYWTEDGKIVPRF